MKRQKDFMTGQKDFMTVLEGVAKNERTRSGYNQGI